MSIQDRIHTLRRHGLGRDVTAAILNITPALVHEHDLDPSTAEPPSDPVESGSGLPDGGTPDQVVVNSAPGVGGWAEPPGHGPVPTPLLGATNDAPLEHVWSIEDVPAPEFANESGWLEYAVSWTPTESGEVLLTAPAWDGTTDIGARVEYRLYTQDPQDGSIPNEIALSSWSKDAAAPARLDSTVADPVTLDAGTQYWLLVLNAEGEDAIGRTVSLKEWATSVAHLGGVQRFSWRPEAEGNLSVAEGAETKAEGAFSHAEGHTAYADSYAAHAEGAYTRATGVYSHAEGGYNEASGYAAHVEGGNNLADGRYSHAEGYETRAQGSAGHAEGQYCRAESTGAHAEGVNTLAGDSGAHAEGGHTSANSTYSHAEGFRTLASGFASHAGGSSSWARQDNDRAQGAGAFTEGAIGEAQYVRSVLKAVTTDDTPFERYVLLAADHVFAIRGMIAARSTDGTLGAAWGFKLAARSDGAGVVDTFSSGASVDRLGADVGADAWDILIEPAAFAQVLTISLIGAAATEIHWSLTVEMQEVG